MVYFMNPRITKVRCERCFADLDDESERGGSAMSSDGLMEKVWLCKDCWEKFIQWLWGEAFAHRETD